MSKSSRIYYPESTMSCDTLDSLQGEYQQAVRDFTKTVKKVRGAKPSKPTSSAPVDILSDPKRVECAKPHTGHCLTTPSNTGAVRVRGTSFSVPTICLSSAMMLICVLSYEPTFIF